MVSSILDNTAIEGKSTCVLRLGVCAMYAKQLRCKYYAWIIFMEQENIKNS